MHRLCLMTALMALMSIAAPPLEVLAKTPDLQSSFIADLNVSELAQVKPAAERGVNYESFQYELLISVVQAKTPAPPFPTRETKNRQLIATDVQKSNSPASSYAEAICLGLARASLENGVPIDFFMRLIWQESHFNSRAQSYVGAQGIAQFMPATARARGLADSFDPLEAIKESARFLKDLRSQFGNLGLAAAAYNAGPGRVRAWLDGRGQLPRQTRAYVQIITGRPAKTWVGVSDRPADRMGTTISCDEIAKLLVSRR